jgi:hypothetical protein
LALGEGDDAPRVVGVHDLRAAVPHAGTEVQALGLDHLDPGHIEGGVEDLAGVDHRIRHCFAVGADGPFR